MSISLTTHLEWFSSLELKTLSNRKGCQGKNEVIKTNINGIMVEIYNKIVKKNEKRPNMQKAIEIFLTKQPSMKEQYLKKYMNFKMCSELQKRLNTFFEGQELYLLYPTSSKVASKNKKL